VLLSLLCVSYEYLRVNTCIARDAHAGSGHKALIGRPNHKSVTHISLILTGPSIGVIGIGIYDITNGTQVFGDNLSIRKLGYVFGECALTCLADSLVPTHPPPVPVFNVEAGLQP
jgi:hypothetical protein